MPSIWSRCLRQPCFTLASADGAGFQPFSVLSQYTLGFAQGWYGFGPLALAALGGIPNRTQVGDMGIDGRIFPVSALDNRRKAKADELQLEDRWYPIQVKQKDKAGRPDIDAFEAMMMREECTKGFFVSFDYTGDAETEVARFFKQTGKVIVLLTVRQILDEQIAHRLA